jgi:hypothetical protein
VVAAEEVPMNRDSERAVGWRLAYVLEGLVFPAAKWQVMMHAEHYGADAVSVAQLWGIPARTYPDLAAVGKEPVSARLQQSTAVRQRVRGGVARHRLRVQVPDGGANAHVLKTG